MLFCRHERRPMALLVAFLLPVPTIAVAARLPERG
jgi:hypothetical protein